MMKINLTNISFVKYYIRFCYSSLSDCLKVSEMKIIKGEHWDIAVVRKCFLKTVMEQLEEATEADWEREMKVTFIG